MNKYNPDDIQVLYKTRIYDLLHLLKAHITVFTGQPDFHLSTLHGFLQGFTEGLKVGYRQYKMDYGFPSYLHFNTWLAGLFPLYSEPSQLPGFRNILLRRHHQDEEKACRAFFEFLEKFKKSRPQATQIAVSDQQREAISKENGICNGGKTHFIYRFILPPSPACFLVFADENHESINISELSNKNQLHWRTGRSIPKKISLWEKLSKEESEKMYRRFFCSQ